jgi:hypothetical protein
MIPYPYLGGSIVRIQKVHSWSVVVVAQLEPVAVDSGNVAFQAIDSASDPVSMIPPIPAPPAP